MASTGAVVFFRPRFVGTSYPIAKATGASVYFPVRMLTGIWTTAGIPQSNLDNLRSLLPAQRSPVVNADRTMTAEWYRFFDFLVNVYLGGPDTPTITDIVSSLESTIQRSTEAAVQAALAQRQTQTNAEALAATVEVVKNNGLTGSSQIPAVATTFYMDEP